LSQLFEILGRKRRFWSCRTGEPMGDHQNS